MADNRNIAQKTSPIPKIGGNPNITSIDPPNLKALSKGLIPVPKVQTGKNISKVGPQARKTFGIPNGQTTATGLEKAIFIAGQGILKAQFAMDGFFYGKFQYTGDNKIKKAIDTGVINLLDDLSNVDLCNILNYAINRIPGSKPFDPENKPSDPLGIAKYTIQKAAYDVQKKIDGFNSSYLESENQDSKAKAVYDIIQEIKDAFKEIDDPEAQSALRDPRLIQTFPQIGTVNDFFEKAFRGFNTYSDFRQIPSAELQKLTNDIDKIRSYTILIQGLNTPAGAIGFVDTVFPNANIQEQIQRIQKIIDPARLMPLLKNVVESLKKVQSVCNVFISFVTTAQGLIRLFTLVIKALKIVVKFLKKLPIPNQFTVLGITNTVSGFCETLLKNIDKLLNRLEQLNTLLSLCVGLLNEVSVILFDIIAKINRMLAGLEACNNVDPQIVKDLQDTRDSLQNTAEYFQKFVENYGNKKNTDTATFGDFTIQIVTEEVVDESFRLRRRYGIALAKNGTIAAKSTPTFASDNQIIINEVKVQLSTLGYVKSDIASFNIEEFNTISESLSFLFDNDINIEDLDIDNFDNGLDSGENEDENNGLGLNAFVNKLQGGKKLRSRMRKMMAKNSVMLAQDLKNTDPTGRYSNSASTASSFANGIAGSQTDNDPTNPNYAKIKSLEADKSRLQEKLSTTKPGILFNAIVTAIKKIDAKLKKLKNS